MHRAMPLLLKLDLSPEARSLLASYVRVHQLARIGRAELRDLAAGLCQTAPVTKRIVEEMVGAGLLIETPADVTRGRPRLGYAGSERLRRLLAGAVNYPLTSLVDYVLKSSNRLVSMHASEQRDAENLSLTELRQGLRQQFRHKAGG